MNLLDHITNRLNSEKPYDSTKSFHISDMGKCFRMRVLKRMGKTAQAIPIRNRMLMQVGNLIHHYIQSSVGGVSEYRVYWPLYELSGRCDLIKDGILYDIKTCHSGKLLYGEVDPNYMKQLITYWLLLRNKFHIRKAVIALVSRDDMLIKEEPFYLLPNVQKEVYSDLQTLRRWWLKRDKELPPELERGNWQCKYCSYYLHCPNVLKWLPEEKGKKRVSKKKSVRGLDTQPIHTTAISCHKFKCKE